ncbi:hypothetical protein H696_01205 [Fonticula alba]|uniref:Uncharacterized protein n=1 Tax=Fonticula alba TaxID=691883 RepID=A0A058ZEA1_FONAL|nr:hypothetical protein H696_01205 [Fonticula alba]KCV71787.1 hypothetical protein H696_01205 [Fonticula alba]|eukprot:XP_009493365.1 hypothetical protein H696_01205 [Fonticula alba]
MPNDRPPVGVPASGGATSPPGAGLAVPALAPELEGPLRTPPAPRSASDPSAAVAVAAVPGISPSSSSSFSSSSSTPSGAPSSTPSSMRAPSANSSSSESLDDKRKPAPSAPAKPRNSASRPTLAAWQDCIAVCTSLGVQPEDWSQVSRTGLPGDLKTPGPPNQWASLSDRLFLDCVGPAIFHGLKALTELRPGTDPTMALGMYLLAFSKRRDPARAKEALVAALRSSKGSPSTGSTTSSAGTSGGSKKKAPPAASAPKATSAAKPPAPQAPKCPTDPSGLSAIQPTADPSTPSQPMVSTPKRKPSKSGIPTGLSHSTAPESISPAKRPRLLIGEAFSAASKVVPLLGITELDASSSRPQPPSPPSSLPMAPAPAPSSVPLHPSPPGGSSSSGTGPPSN